ncbi:uncharacterized protein ELE39_000330 [Cryptosporidium sp. chipmunk genotype I]|uniref:uncharacterized protein n=1 Tax=Cryptosporidium sp. chipmunk genotype I TaxID=1280935 RepID=UPI003519F727|nr:hypothetical protein ELE39_000330 [Cryptosporidium sp. chipmunk genotype I]
MSCSNNNTTYQEDEYLIILRKDECSNDKELEEAIKLNLNENYYIYERTEFIDDSINYQIFSSQILLKRINSLKNYIKTSDLNIPLNLNKFKEMINEFLSLIDINIVQKKDSLNKEMGNLILILTSNFEKNIKKARINIEFEKKIKKSIDLIYLLLKKKTGLYRSETASEELPILNKNQNESEIEDECKRSLSNIESEVNCFGQKMESIGSNSGIIEFVTSKEVQENQNKTNFNKDKNNFNLNQYPLSSAIESGRILNEAGSDSSEDSNMDDNDSDISQKSEPIINKNRMHKLYRKAGTVINGNDSPDISDTKLDKDKYLKLIESYKSLARPIEVKENISANHT